MRVSGLCAFLQYFDGGNGSPFHRRSIHDYALGSLYRRYIVHHVHHQGLDYRPEPTRAGIARDSLVRDSLDGPLLEHELDLVEAHRFLVLTQNRVLRLRDDPLEILAGEILERDLDGQSSDELGDHPEFDEIVGMELREKRLYVLRAPGLDIGPEAERVLGDAALDDLVEAHEGAAADEQDIGGIDAEILLLGMLAAALGRNVGERALDDLEESLLDALLPRRRA